LYTCSTKYVDDPEQAMALVMMTRSGADANHGNVQTEDGVGMRLLIQLLDSAHLPKPSFAKVPVRAVGPLADRQFRLVELNIRLPQGNTDIRSLCAEVSTLPQHALRHGDPRNKCAVLMCM